MNVRLWPRACPGRTLLYSGVVQVFAAGGRLYLEIATGIDPRFAGWPALPARVVEEYELRAIAEIALDEDGAAPL